MIAERDLMMTHSCYDLVWFLIDDANFVLIIDSGSAPNRRDGGLVVYSSAGW